MNKKVSLRLGVPTEPGWVHVILENFDAFLADHADCERKASALAMHLVSKCPDREDMISPLIELALEELRHFREVYDLMRRRGVRLLQRSIRDPYVNRLGEVLRSGREERLLDRLLIASIIESRGAERFKILADHLKDKELEGFYRRLYAAETKHGSLFVTLALRYFDQEIVEARLSELIEKEAEIIRKLEWRPSLH